MNIDDTDLIALAAKPNARPHAGRRKFSHRFKIGAVKMATEDGASMSSVARTLNISPGLLARWVHQFGTDAEQTHGADGPTTSPEVELDLLRTENQRLREESDVYVRLIAHFAKQASLPRDGSLGRAPEGPRQDRVEFFRPSAS